MPLMGFCRVSLSDATEAVRGPPASAAQLLFGDSLSLCSARDVTAAAGVDSTLTLPKYRKVWGTKPSQGTLRLKANEWKFPFCLCVSP